MAMIIGTIFCAMLGILMMIGGIKFFSLIEWRYWWDEIFGILMGTIYSGGGIVFLMLTYDALVCITGWHLPNIITTF